MNLLAAIGLINGILSLVFGLFVLSRNPRAIVNITYFIFDMAIALFNFGYFFWQLSNNINQALYWFKILTIGIIFINVTFLHVSLSILGKAAEKKKILIGLYLINFIFVILNFKLLLYTKLVPKYNFGYWPIPTPLFYFYLSFWLGQAIYGLILLYKGFLTSIGHKKEQIRYFILACILGFIGGSTNWPLWFNINFPPYLNILIAIHVPLTAYAIYRYRFLDINVALTRAGIFAFVYTLVLGIPFGVIILAKPFIANLGYYGMLIPLLLGMSLASAGPFIYMYLQRRAEDLLLADQRRYQKALRELSKTMTRIRDLDKLLKMIVLTVADTVKVSYAGIYLKDEEYKSYALKHYYPKLKESRFPEVIPLESPLISSLYSQKRPLTQEEAGVSAGFSLDSGLAIPCFMEDELLGFLIMGPKPNNQIYTSDDILVFETLSYSTSLAIENCRFWREIEDRQRKARLQEMDTYSYSLAHEIDNPVQIILGEAGFLKKFFLKDASLSEEKQKDAETILDFILESAARISGMVRAIREFGSPTTGELKPLKIKDVAESYLRLYLPQFKAEGVVLEKLIPEGLGMVRGEKPELMQVLVILSNNSLHAMKYSKEKKITLKLEQVNSDIVRISFTDTGCGIKKELLPIIFSPFTTTKASSEGTGMGLYNAKKIIDRHKGRIWAESEGENRGVTFFIELPFAKDVKPEELEEKDKGKRLF